jgi:predicted small lipoprotein YifL
MTMTRSLFPLLAVAIAAAALAGCGRKDVDTSMTSGAPSAGAPASAAPNDPIAQQSGVGQAGSTSMGSPMTDGAASAAR